MKTKQVTVQFKGQTISLPEGLRAKPVKPYPTQTRPQYWLDEFPERIFPKGSILLHDAVHYGVWLEESDVQSETGYQPKTGAKCSCRPGMERDNCATCEGTGWVIDFVAIRARKGAK